MHSIFSVRTATSAGVAMRPLIRAALLAAGGDKSEVFHQCSISITGRHLQHKPVLRNSSCHSCMNKIIDVWDHTKKDHMTISMTEHEIIWTWWLEKLLRSVTHVHTLNLNVIWILNCKVLELMWGCMASCSWINTWSVPSIRYRDQMQKQASLQGVTLSTILMRSLVQGVPCMNTQLCANGYL